MGRNVSPHEAPDVDPVIFMEGAPRLKPGDMVEVEIVGNSDYDYLAHMRSGASGDER